MGKCKLQTPAAITNLHCHDGLPTVIFSLIHGNDSGLWSIAALIHLWVWICCLKQAADCTSLTGLTQGLYEFVTRAHKSKSIHSAWLWKLGQSALISKHPDIQDEPKTVRGSSADLSLERKKQLASLGEAKQWPNTYLTESTLLSWGMIKAIIAILYIWSAMLSGFFTSLLTHPVLGVSYGLK